MRGWASDIAIGGFRYPVIYIVGKGGAVMRYNRGHFRKINAPRAKRIAVSVRGQPVIVTPRGDISRREKFAKSFTWESFRHVNAISVAAGPEGSLVYVNKYGAVLKARKAKGAKHIRWKQIAKNGGVDGAVGKGGRILGLGKNGDIYWPRDACTLVWPLPIRERYGYVFWLGKHRLNWYAARRQCYIHGGDLASLKNGYEVSFAKYAAGRVHRFWLGQHYTVGIKNGTWFWSDGMKNTKFMQRKWASGYPRGSAQNADCGIGVNSRTRFDLKQAQCGRRMHYVCKRLRKYKQRKWVGFHPAHQYRWFARYYTWNHARQTCNNWGGDLASIGSYAEQRYVRRVCGSRARSVWIGFNRGGLKARWVWSDTEANTFMFWRSGRIISQRRNTSNHGQCAAAQMNSYDMGRWVDQRCNKKKTFVCKRPLHFKHVVRKHQYMLRRHASTWFNAQQVCRAWGGDLASLTNYNEHRHVFRMIKRANLGRAWIGGHYTRKAWRWSSGRQMSWEWFTHSSKKAGCAEMKLHNYRGKWSSRNCHRRSAYVCKRRVGAKAKNRAW